jgi:hypothetical protein
VGAKKKGAKKARRVIEYIKVPKHWFSDPLNHAMKTAVRPPTKRTRRKELVIDLHVPQEVFYDMMKPMDDGDMEGFKWEEAAKTKLAPTTDTKTFQQFKYEIKKPQMVDKFWCLQNREQPRRVRKEGEMVTCRRGLDSARLHLSAAAEARGELTDLLAAVTGNVSVLFKVPKEERAMPKLQMKFKVSTMTKTGHIEWATSFAPRTAAALRKQMQQHLLAMIEDPEYPTLSTSPQEVLTQQTDCVRPLALMPPPPQADA